MIQYCIIIIQDDQKTFKITQAEYRAIQNLELQCLVIGLRVEWVSMLFKTLVLKPVSARILVAHLDLSES